jgi:lysyl-tRNA synthetase class 2
MAERREKLKQLRQAQAAGQAVAFPNDFKPAHRAAALLSAHDGKTPEDLQAQAHGLPKSPGA